MAVSEFRQCELLGFGEQDRQNALYLLDLGEGEKQWAKLLHERVIHPHLAAITERFYERMLTKPQFIEILVRGDFSLDNLKKTQMNYLDTLGLGFDQASYFEDRLRVGLVHARVGVPLSLYQRVYCILQEEIMVFIRKEIPAEQQSRVSRFLLRITNLDMSLAISAYHGSRVDSLEHSLDLMQHERAHLERKASQDSLTGMLNHSAILHHLDQVLAHLGVDYSNVHLIMADLDHFKTVNDRFGHLVGDKALIGVASRIRGSLRDMDAVGRYGGEEFTIILVNKTREQALQIAERIRERVEQHPIHHQDTRFCLTISQGLAEAVPGESAASLLERADRALYDAKKTGRNRVVLADQRNQA